MATSNLTLSSARAWSRQFARNSQDASMYSATNIDRALQLAGDEWVRITHATKTAGTLTLTAGSNILPAAPTGWAPEYHLQHYLFLNGQIVWPELQFVDYDEVLQSQFFGWNGVSGSVGTSNTFTGRPAMFGYRDITNGISGPGVPDQPYQIQFWYWQQFTSWTPGIGLASVSATATGGNYLYAVSIADGGYYANTPTVTISDTGSGSGGTVVATINTSGVVSALAITASGHNYTSPTLLFNGVSAADFVFNVTDDQVRVIASDGVEAFLQEMEPENSGINQRALVRFRERAEQVAGRGPGFRGGTVSYKDSSGYGNQAAGGCGSYGGGFVPYVGSPYVQPIWPGGYIA